MGIETIDPLVIREEQRSYETGVYILPLPSTWQHSGQVLLQTPARNYTVGDYSHFFDDINFSEGLDMMENILDYVNLTSPGVRTVCVFTLGIQTPIKLIYTVRPEASILLSVALYISLSRRTFLMFSPSECWARVTGRLQNIVWRLVNTFLLRMTQSKLSKTSTMLMY